MLEKCVLTILELNLNQRLGHKRTKLNICHHMLTSSTQLLKRSFHVVERTRTSTKCQKNEKCTCKVCKTTVFHCQIWKFVGFLLPSSSWLLKLSILGLQGGFKGNCKMHIMCFDSGCSCLLAFFSSHPPIFRLRIHSIHWFLPVMC